VRHIGEVAEIRRGKVQALNALFADAKLSREVGARLQIVAVGQIDVRLRGCGGPRRFLGAITSVFESDMTGVAPSTGRQRWSKILRADTCE
jgi:hypothetical protein